MQKSHLTYFLERVMIDENGLYVLEGVKPVSEFTVNRTTIETTNLHPRHCYQTQWILWQEIYQNRLKEDYLLIARKSKNGNQEGLFVNIPVLTNTLTTNYQDFKEIYGSDFSPTQKITELTSEHSEFWDKIFDSHLGKGLIFGFGRNNSLNYTKQNIAPQKTLIKNQRTVKTVEKLLNKRDLTPSDLTIPFFHTYEETDRTIEHYQKERAKIIHHYKSKHFPQEVLKQLLIPFPEPSPLKQKIN